MIDKEQVGPGPSSPTPLTLHNPLPPPRDSLPLAWPLTPIFKLLVQIDLALHLHAQGAGGQQQRQQPLHPVEEPCVPKHSLRELQAWPGVSSYCKHLCLDPGVGAEIICILHLTASHLRPWA